MKEKVIILGLSMVTCFSIWGLVEQSRHFNSTITDVVNSYNEIMISNEPELKTEIPYKKVGKFELTWYCPCEKCAGKKEVVLTKTGTKPKSGRTIAVDPKKIPLGSIVYIQDYGYFIAEDIGGAIKGNHIDIYVDSHEEALKNGKRVANVYVLGKV